MFRSQTIQVQNPLPSSPHFLSTVNNLQVSHFKMSSSHRSKAGRRVITNTTTAASGPRTRVVSSKTDTTVVDERSARTGTTSSEMSIADVVDKDCDSDTGTATNLYMQCGSGESEKGLGGVAPFIKRNPDKVMLTLEWRERVLHSQEATQGTSYRQQHTAEERRRASLEHEIEKIRRRYQDWEMILESEITQHEERYDLAIKQLEREENEEEDYSATEWWEVQSDYQLTECGNDA